MNTLHPTLRLMTRDDLETVLSWRNHPSIRKHMYSQHEITLEEHLAWFEAMTRREDVELLVFEISGIPTGYTKLDMLDDKTTAEWGFYVSPDAPKGTGTLLGKAVLEHAFEHRKLDMLRAEVIGTNKKSLGFHRKMGFKTDKTEEKAFFDGESRHAIVYMSISASDWRNGQSGVSK